MLCLLPVQDHSHPRGAHGAVLPFAQEPKSSLPRAQHGPSKWAAVESRVSSPHTLQTEAQRLRTTTTFSGRGKKQAVVISSTRQMSSPIPSLRLRQPQCQAEATALPLPCPAPFCHFSVPLGLLALVQEDHGRVSCWGI